MKTAIIAIVVGCIFESIAQADELQIAMKGEPVAQFSNPDDIDWIRTNLVFVFDTAAHHCQEGSESRWKPNQKEIKDLVDRVKRGSYLEMTFSEPTPITVESKKFLMKRLWVSIRELDWGTFDWTVETAEGDLVVLSGIQGIYNRKLGPIVQSFVEDYSEQGTNGHPTTAVEAKPE